MYQENYLKLKEIVDKDGVIINVSKHRKPDGSMYVETN